MKGAEWIDGRIQGEGIDEEGNDKSRMDGRMDTRWMEGSVDRELVDKRRMDGRMDRKLNG